MRESERSSIDKYTTIQRRNKMANQAPPKFIKLFNQIALGEAQAGKYLKAWANTTNDPDVKEALNLVALRETEHAFAFEKRLCELGYDLKMPEDQAKRNEQLKSLMKIATSNSMNDCEKFEKFGLNKPQNDKPDLFSKMFSIDKTMDPASGALLGRYIAEERDSGRKFYEAYTCVMEKASKNTIGTSSHLVAELERLSKLHIDGCLSEDEFKQAKSSVLKLSIKL